MTLSEHGNNVHSQVLLTMVQGLLAQTHCHISQLDAIAVGQGPGSFTGLRIGIGVAQGLAFGADCPMVGVSSLDALANQASRDGAIIAGIDARMGEVYWCEYQKTDKNLLRQTQLQVSRPQDIHSVLTQQPLELLGNAWDVYQGQFRSELIERALINQNQAFPCASSLLSLAEDLFINGQAISPVDFAPEYVRNDVAKKSVKK